MNLNEAAGFACVALTAYYALFELINFKQN